MDFPASWTGSGSGWNRRNPPLTAMEDRRMTLRDGMLQELEQEAHTTRRVLERVPGNHLGWRPHHKARTLGELALHVATVPGTVAALASSPSPAQAPQFGPDPSPSAA